MENRRAQEEIVGFIMIILLVVIIGVVFLAIELRKPTEKLNSKELESFLQASMKTTSDCYRSSEIRYDLKSLISACSTNEQCLNSINSCDLLNRTFNYLVIESFNPGPDSQVKRVRVNAYKKDTNATIYKMQAGGNCTGTRQIGGLSSSEMIRVEIEICG
jgi:hypothetical protein